MSDMKPLYCDEHGAVMRVGEFKSTVPGATMTFFCPVCQRELFPDDPLTEIERQGQPAPTMDEWASERNVLGTIRANLADGSEPAA